MKKQRIHHKYLKQVMVAMTLVLALGLFVGLDVKPAFGEPAEVTIAATSNNTAYGTVTGGGVYLPGATVQLDAIPKAGCRFVDWLESTTMISSNSTLSFTADVNRTLVGVFAPIAKPVITSATSKGYDSVKIAWGKVEGAASYDLYQAVSATGPYTKVANTASLSYTQTGLTTGKTYYYSVKAVCQANVTVTTSSASAYKAVTPIPSTPAITAASASYNSIKISWAKITGATGYRVYRATSSTGSYSYLGATAGLYYNNTSLITGKTYYYKVIAYHTEGTAKIYSKASAAAYARAIPATPTISAITKTSTSSKVSWYGITGTTAYRVYRSTSATGTYSLIATVGPTARSYINTGLTLGKTYYYKVRSYHLEGTTKVYSYASAVKSVTIGNLYYAGVYKVGTQIPAGEYYVLATGDASYIGVSTDAAGDNLIGDAYPTPNYYVTLKTGQYFTVEASKVYPIAKAPMAPKDANGNMTTGQYKVGRDIDPGEYVLVAATDDAVYLAITNNSTLAESSYAGLDVFPGMGYVTLSAGQYIDMSCKASYAITDPNAPVADTSSGTLNNGMYKVGRDFPAGTYTLEATSADARYLVVNNATHPLTDFFLGNDLTGTKDVTFTDGQYVFLSDCALHLSVVL